MSNLLKKLWKDESALSATEYGILAGIFAAAIITVLVTFRNKVVGLFNQANTGLDSAGAGTP
jgi:Flp pilus assembly pilin Flp